VIFFRRLINRYDPEGMLGVLTRFPAQAQTALGLKLRIQRQPRIDRGGDFMSYYLALLNLENPGSVAAVEQLKTRLAG
jgi:hypothetical protein